MIQKAEKVVERMRTLDSGIARARQRNSSQNNAKTHIETSWMTIPAIIVCVPGLVSPNVSWPAAFEAKPPPMACMTIEIKSKEMKMPRYVVGEMKL